MTTKLLANFLGIYFLTSLPTMAVGREPQPVAITILAKARLVAESEVELLRVEAQQKEIRRHHLQVLHDAGNASWQELVKATTDAARGAIRTQAAEGLLADIKTLELRRPNANDIDRPFPSDVYVLVLQTIPAQAGTTVIRPSAELFSRCVELKLNPTGPAIDPDATRKTQLQAQTTAATERVKQIRQMPHSSASLRNELIQATLKLRMCEAAAARQLAIEQLVALEDAWAQQCLSYARQSSSTASGVRVALMGGARNEFSPAKLTALETRMQMQALRTKSIVELAEQGHASVLEVRGAKSRLAAAQFQREMLEQVVGQIAAEMPAEVPAANPSQSLQPLIEKLPGSSMQNVSVLLAIIRLRQGLWESWSAHAEAQAVAAFFRERGSRVTSLVGNAFDAEKQYAALDRELAEQEVGAARASMAVWDQMHALFPKAWTSENGSTVETLRPPNAEIEPSPASDQRRDDLSTPNEFLRRADLLLGLVPAPIQEAEAFAHRGRQLDKQTDYLGSLLKEGHVTPFQITEARLRATMATSAASEIRGRLGQMQREIEFLRELSIDLKN